MLAAVGCKEFKTVKDAVDKIVKVVEIVKPDPDLVSKYDIAYSKFKKIYPTVKELYDELI